MHFDLITFIGLLGGAFYLGSHYMHRMVPLRVLSLCSNVLLIGFALFHLRFDWAQPIVLPEFLLDVILLPMNAKRLAEIVKLSREIEKMTDQSPLSEWLLPHVHLQRYKAGHVLFREGDAAQEIYDVGSGTLRLEGAGTTIGPDNLVGEIGLFSPDKKRTLTVVCETDCDLCVTTDEPMYQLCYVSPKLGFYFMRPVVARLRNDVQRSKAALQAD